MSAKFVQGDTGSILRVTCTNDDDDTVINLTGATVTLRWSIDSAAEVSRTMTIQSPPTAGIAQYQFATGELIAGLMKYRIKITDSSGKIITSLSNTCENIADDAI